MNTRYFYLALLAIVAAAIIYFVPRQTQAPQNGVVVYDFDTCAEAGYPVAESNPRTCRTPDGKTYTEDLGENAEVVVETPKPNDLVKSPLTVEGKARGFWFFEDNIPVTLKDANGKVLAQKGFQSKDGNWMTTDYVEFQGTLEFATPATETGTLYIEKDNPSGLPEHAASFAVPVKFR